jgi:hypothetical protein
MEKLSEKKFKRSAHVVLTSHSKQLYKSSLQINWGAKTPSERGPVIASLTDIKERNAIGTHSGSYAVYRALSIAQGSYDINHKPDLQNTESPVPIGPFPSWSDPEKMVSIDPWGLDVQINFKKLYDEGYDIRPTISVTQAHLQLPEIHQAIAAGRLKIDGKIVKENMDIKVTKVALRACLVFAWYCKKNWS